MPPAYRETMFYLIQAFQGCSIMIPGDTDSNQMGNCGSTKKDRGFITSGFTQLGEELAPGQ
jgi:hypothetical protein